MKNRVITVTGMILLCGILCSGCAGKSKEQSSVNAETAVAAAESEEAKTEETEQRAEETEQKAEETEQKTEAQDGLPDGTYTVDFDTDSSMFHVSEASEGKGSLTVENGQMTIHISLASKKIEKLYQGLAENAVKDGAELLLPTTDTVTYSDGTTEEVYGFDVPVPALNEEFDLALIGTKGTWYDHKVSVSGAEPSDDNTVQTEASLEDGDYTVELTFEGGSGKAVISSSALIRVSQEKVTATVEWNSPNYDYMIVDGEKYLPVNTEGNSVFEIPVLFFDEPMEVLGDTVAMSTPHEIAYTLTFHSDTVKAAE